MQIGTWGSLSNSLGVQGGKNKTKQNPYAIMREKECLASLLERW